MNKEIVHKVLIYKELGLSPIWKSLPKKEEVRREQLPTNLSIVYLKKIKLETRNILFIAPVFNSSEAIELELFKKISVYLDKLSDKLSQPQPLKIIQESELVSEMSSCDRLILLEEGIDKLIEKENLAIPYISSVSLKEMVKNPEKKRKLWQDIKELSKPTT